MSAEANSLMEIKEKIQAADMVLVGIGEEFEDEAFLQEKENYAENLRKNSRGGSPVGGSLCELLILKRRYPS